MTCSEDGCNRKHYAHGLCSMHLQRLQRHGSVDGKEKPEKKCSVEGCDKKHRSNGFCAVHRVEFRRRGSVDVFKIEGLPGEEWAEIAQHTGLLISTFGRVKSVRQRHEKLLTPRLSKDQGAAKEGVVIVSDSHLGKKINVAMEVLRAFVPNEHNDFYPHFRDGDRANVRLDNLAWHGYNVLIDKAILMAEQSKSKWADCLLKFWHGDNDALDEFWEEMRRRLHHGIPRRLDRLGLNHWYIDIDNIVQEALVQAFLQIRRGMIMTVDNITGWVFAIAKYITHKWMKSAVFTNSIFKTDSEGDEYNVADTIGFCHPSAELAAMYKEMNNNGECQCLR